MSFKLLTADALRTMAASAEVNPLFRAESERFWLNLITKDRPKTRIAEMHDEEADIYLVLEGEADLHLGGVLVDASSPSPGQHLGSGLDGAERRRIAAGDLVIIPEGVAHMLDARNSRIVYLVVKEQVGPSASG